MISWQRGLVILIGGGLRMFMCFLGLCGGAALSLQVKSEGLPVINSVVAELP